MENLLRIQDVLKKDAIIINIQASDKIELLTQMGSYLAVLYNLKNQSTIIQKILDREAEMSTGIGYGIAIPHARIEGVEGVYMVAAQSVQGIEFGAIDEQPVHLIFMMISPKNASIPYTHILSSLSRIMSYEEMRQSLIETKSADAFLSIIARGEDKYVE
jgi:mannitol/fructose-specific phosphotransferase system IIA component (Ntr-type)